jgi:hypothetical protein
VLVQAAGNSGYHPIDSCPVAGVTLPQRDAGGFGTGTKTGITLTGTNGALVKKSGTAALTTTNLSQDVTTNNTPACTVVGLQTNPLDSTTPRTTDTLRWDGSKWAVSIGQPRFIQVFGCGTGNATQIGHTDAPGVLGTVAQSAAPSTETQRLDIPRLQAPQLMWPREFGKVSTQGEMASTRLAQAIGMPIASARIKLLTVVFGWACLATLRTGQRLRHEHAEP